MKLKQLSKSLLTMIFKVNLTNPEGTNATKFRAEHHTDLDLLDDLESSGYLERRDNRYKLSLFALAELLESVDEVKDVVKKCDHVFHILYKYYLEHPGESISPNDLSTMSSFSREDVGISLTYMTQAAILGAWTTDLWRNMDAKVTPSESILRHKNFYDVLKKERSLRTQRASTGIGAETWIEESSGNLTQKMILLKRLEKLYRRKEIKDGFSSKQACLEWSNKVAPLLRFNNQYYANFLANAHKMNLRLSPPTIESAFSIMISQLRMAIEELKSDIEFARGDAITGTESGRYIDETRIKELKDLPKKGLDLTRLVRILKEINLCSQHQCFMATISLVRALIDHVPPIFGCKNFPEVANNYRGSKSFNESMQHLEKSSRKIADQYLHCQIRRTEILPNKTQVNFSPEVDLLLAEIVRISRQ